MNIFKKPFFWVITIFICASLFRLASLDLIEFKLDESRDVLEMVKFYKEPHLFEKGPIQSTGIYNPPFWYYLLTVISLPSRDPQYLSFIIGLLNSAAIAGLYLVVRKFYGHLEGVISSLLLAFSPWSIIFSRKIWSPDLIMVFLVPLFYFLLQLVHSKSTSGESKKIKWAWFWVPLLLSLIWQLHASGLFLAVGVLATFIILKIRINFKYALVGLLISLIPLLPFIYYQATSDPFCPDCQTLIGYYSGSSAQGESKAFDGSNFLRPFEFISGPSFNLELGGDYQNFIGGYPFIGIVISLFIAEFLLAFAGIIYLIKKKRERYLILLLLIIPSFYFVTQTQANMHYYIILSITSILIYTFSICQFIHHGGAGAKTILGWGIFGLILTLNIIFNLTFFDFLGRKQMVDGDYGPIYKLTKQKTEEQLAKYQSSPDYELIRAEYWVRMFNNPSGQ